MSILTYDLLFCIKYIEECSYLLNLLNKSRKRDKMRDLSGILSIFRNEFDKFNNTPARILDFIYHMTLKVLKNHIFGLKTSRFFPLLRNVIMNFIMQSF